MMMVCLFLQGIGSDVWKLTELSTSADITSIAMASVFWAYHVDSRSQQRAHNSQYLDKQDIGH